MNPDPDNFGYCLIQNFPPPLSPRKTLPFLVSGEAIVPEYSDSHFASRQPLCVCHEEGFTDF